jgi:hypothetical protein
MYAIASLRIDPIAEVGQYAQGNFLSENVQLQCQALPVAEHCL